MTFEIHGCVDRAAAAACLLEAGVWMPLGARRQNSQALSRVHELRLQPALLNNHRGLDCSPRLSCRGRFARTASVSSTGTPTQGLPLSRTRFGLGPSRLAKLGAFRHLIAGRPGARGCHCQSLIRWCFPPGEFPGWRDLFPYSSARQPYIVGMAQDM